MVDAIVTTSAQTLTARPYTQERATAAFAPSQVSPVNKGGFVSSSIRVDNLQNVAILEFRTEEGEVLQQYPNQSQIEAFQRARTLERRVAETASATVDAAPVAAAAPANSGTSVAAPSEGGATSVVV